MKSRSATQSVFSLLGVLLGVSLAWPSLAAEPLSSTYQPTLTVVIDGVGAGRTVVIRAHRENPAQDDLVLCSQGLCAFHNNQHEDEAAWTYTVEQLKTKAPAAALDNVAELTTWYAEHHDSLVTSFDVTTAIHQAPFIKTPRKRDYTLYLTSADHGVELATVDTGEYNPLPQEFSFSNLSFPVDGFRKHAVEIGALFGTLLIIYYGIKIVII